MLAGRTPLVQNESRWILIRMITILATGTMLFLFCFFIVTPSNPLTFRSNRSLLTNPVSTPFLHSDDINPIIPMEPREWRPKWITIPYDQLHSHFTEYELSSMKALESLNASSPFNKTQKNKILRENPCDVDYGLTSCCLGSSSAGGGNKYRPERDGCYQRRYDIRMDLFQHRPPLTSHHLFWTLPNNSNIFIIGDSVQHQIFDGFVCDAIRQNQHGFIPDDQPPIAMERQQHQPHDNASSMMMAQWVPNWQQLADRHKISDVEVTLNSSKNGQNHVVKVVIIRNNRPSLELYNDTFCEWANVILFNWDLHYKSPYDEEWDEDIGNGIFPILQKCFDRYAALERKPIFIWTEVTAQHFGGTIGGFWENIYSWNRSVIEQYRQHIAKEEHDPDLLTNHTKWNDFFASKARWTRNAECGPHHYFMDESFERHVRRQRIMETVDGNPDLTFNLEIVYPDRPIQQHREDTLYFIPLKDATVPLWNLHKTTGDCTHWCHTPYLWELLWDSMARIVERNDI